MTENRRVPRWVKAVAAIVLGGGGAVAFTAWQVGEIRQEEQQRDCRRAVAARDDGRAVWLYLVARDPERADDPDVVEFVEFLDSRLPPLRCVAGDPTPISTTEES